MFRGFALALLLCVPAMAARAEDNVLTTQQGFDVLWAPLVQELGPGAQIAELSVTPDRIDVTVQSPQGGAFLDRWSARPGRFWGVHVRGPEPLQVGDFLGDPREAMFPLADVPTGQLVDLVAVIAAEVPLLQPGRVEAVRIARQMSILPEPSYGEVRWSVTVATDRESAEAITDAEGRLIGIDLSQTERGRNRDFLSQPEWDFALAAEGLANLTGPEAVVWQISLSAKTLTVEADSPDTAKALTSWSWDGGRFTRGLVDSPNIHPMMHGGGTPFALSEAQVARLPAIIAAAKAALPHLTLRGLTAEKPVPLTGAAEVVWVAELSARPRKIVDPDYEAGEVRLRPDGTVLQVILPESERPPLDLLSGTGAAAAMAAFAGVVGEGSVYEVLIRSDRAELLRPDPVDVEMDMTIVFNGKGLSEGFDRPGVFHSAADLIPMARFAALDAATVDAMKARAMAEIPLPGSEVYSLRFWNGAPWWQSPDGAPLVDVRVGVPPRHDVSGYAVFQMDGTLVEVVK